MTTKRFDWDLNGIWDFQSDSDEYIESSKEICELLNELHEEKEFWKKMVIEIIWWYEDREKWREFYGPEVCKND